MFKQGRSQDFHLGGGGGGAGRKRLCASTHITARNRTCFRQGSRARLRALEALGFFNALSCNLCIIFKHSDKKKLKKTKT